MAGSIVATIDGVEQTTHAYDVHAPGSTTVTFAPGATFMYMEPMMMGDVVLVPAYYHVSVLTYDIELENNQQGAIELNVLVDPETLELTMLEDLRVVYHPNGLDPDNWYVLTDGQLTLNKVVVIDDDTWSISGTIDGYVSRQVSYYPEHNPAEMFRIVARFEFPRVARQESPF